LYSPVVRRHHAASQYRELGSRNLNLLGENKGDHNSLPAYLGWDVALKANFMRLLLPVMDKEQLLQTIG